MSKNPFVSVVIVNYNGKSFIKECVESVLQSNYSGFEVVIVENASIDGSFQYLQKLYGKNKIVKIIRTNEQLYFAGGSNLGAKNSKGKQLIFLNSDAVVEKNWMKELVKFAKSNNKFLVQPKILLYHRKNIIDNVGGNYSFFGFGSGKGHGERDEKQHDKDTQIDFANGTCFTISKKFFKKLGEFDDWYQLHYEDVDLNLRAKKNGGKSWYCYKSVIYHKGSLTVKAHIASEKLLYNIRKNRLRTVIKNFSGCEKLLRLAVLLGQYFVLAVQDISTLKKERIFVTIRSIIINFV